MIRKLIYALLFLGLLSVAGCEKRRNDRSIENTLSAFYSSIEKGEMETTLSCINNHKISDEVLKKVYSNMSQCYREQWGIDHLQIDSIEYNRKKSPNKATVYFTISYKSGNADQGLVNMIQADGWKVNID